jgi:hypothetical protein
MDVNASVAGLESEGAHVSNCKSIYPYFTFEITILIELNRGVNSVRPYKRSKKTKMVVCLFLCGKRAISRKMNQDERSKRDKRG